MDGGVAPQGVVEAIKKFIETVAGHVVSLLEVGG